MSDSDIVEEVLPPNSRPTADPSVVDIDRTSSAVRTPSVMVSNPASSKPPSAMPSQSKPPSVMASQSRQPSVMPSNAASSKPPSAIPSQSRPPSTIPPSSNQSKAATASVGGDPSTRALTNASRSGTATANPSRSAQQSTASTAAPSNNNAQPGRDYVLKDKKASVAYDKDGDWVLDRTPRYTFRNVKNLEPTESQLNNWPPRKKCCLDEERPPLSFTQNLRVFYDVLAGQDSFPCNECDRPMCKETLWQWVQSSVGEMVDTVKSIGQRPDTTTTSVGTMDAETLRINTKGTFADIDDSVISPDKPVTQASSKVVSSVNSSIHFSEKAPSQVPSKIPTQVSSKAPSQVSSKVPSQVSSKVPSQVSSKVPSQVNSTVVLQADLDAIPDDGVVEPPPDVVAPPDDAPPEDPPPIEDKSMIVSQISLFGANDINAEEEEEEEEGEEGG